MRIGSMLLLLLIASHTAWAQADFNNSKIIKLEQDVRNLERQVQDLSRQLSELQRSARVNEQRTPSASDRSSTPAPATSSWLDAANWNRIRTGMTELEVIDLLGPPTSMREDAGSRVLLYAMEIGSSGFLGGSIKLEDRRVTEVQKPVLK